MNFEYYVESLVVPCSLAEKFVSTVMIGCLDEVRCCQKSVYLLLVTVEEGLVHFVLMTASWALQNIGHIYN